MTPLLLIDVLGVCVPFVRVTPGGKAGGVYQDKRYVHWKQLIQDAAREAARAAGWRKTLEAVRCDCEFVLLRLPTKKAKEPTPWPSSGRVGDRDNYDKAVLDALTRAGIWKDDRQVCVGMVAKRWQRDDESFAGVLIRVEILP